jgi:hypothetical protein
MSHHPIGRKMTMRRGLRAPYAASVAVLMATAVLFGGYLGCSFTRHTTAFPVTHGYDGAPPADAHLYYRLILIGDAGKVDGADPVMRALVRVGKEAPTLTTAVFLGDNVYERGLAAEGHKSRAEGEAYLTAQLDAVRDAGIGGILIPGNHDWQVKDADPLGPQRTFVQNYAQLQAVAVEFLPPKGGPGPSVVDLGGPDGPRLIAIDSEWWLREAHRSPAERDAMLRELRKNLQDAGDRHVVFAAHHPIRSHGKHDGHFYWTSHLHPFPVMGTVVALARILGGYNQDLMSERYRTMVASLTDAFSVKKPLVYAAGHDHSLQVLEGGEVADYVVVSGSGAKVTPVGDAEDTLFAHMHRGFFVLDFTDKGVYLRVVEPARDERVLPLTN